MNGDMMSSQAEKKPKETMKFYVLAIITLLIGNVIGYFIGSAPVGQLREDVAKLEREIALLKLNLTWAWYNIEVLNVTRKYDMMDFNITVEYLRSLNNITWNALWDVAHLLQNKIDELDARLKEIERQGSIVIPQKKVSTILTGGGYGTTGMPFQGQIIYDFDLSAGSLNITITISSNFTIPGYRGVTIELYKGVMDANNLAKEWWTNQVGEFIIRYEGLKEGHYVLRIYSSNAKWSAYIEGG
ncbi:MAG: hypothetical protein QXZ66_04750 [Thermoproteota archaeon]